MNIFPFAPVPLIPSRSIPSCPAIFLARGVAFTVLPAAKLSTSASWTLPFGPEPGISPRFRLLSLAFFLAAGVALFSLSDCIRDLLKKTEFSSVSFLSGFFSSLITSAVLAFSSVSLTVSPFSPIYPITVNTGSTSSSNLTFFIRKPELSASTSILTLSVNISTIGSPSFISSPSLFSHFTIVPSSIDIPAFGIIISTDMFPPS